MACLIFDPYPKDSRENFYDREAILDEVEKLISGKFWPLLVGPKRVGKTSIVKIVTKELHGMYIDASGINSLRGLGEAILSQISNLEVKFQLDLKLLKIEINRRPTTALQSILSKLGDTVIGIDEVQNIVTPWFISVLSTAYNTSEIRFIFTGSMIGLADILAGNGKGKKFQIKGRPIVEKEVNPFSREETIGFLKYGSEKCGLRITEEEMEDAYNTYQGIVG